jgi:hypothetical protein
MVNIFSRNNDNSLDDISLDEGRPLLKSREGLSSERQQRAILTRRQAGVFHPKNKIKIAEDEIKPYTRAGKYWKRFKFYSEGYRVNGVLIAGGAVGIIVGGVMFPPVVITAALVAGTAAFNVIAATGVDEQSTAKLDNIIQYSKRSSKLLSALTVGCAVGTVFFPPLVFPTMSFGAAAAVSLTVQNKAIKRKNDLYRGVIVENDFSAKEVEIGKFKAKDKDLDNSPDLEKYQSSIKKRRRKAAANISEKFSTLTSALPDAISKFDQLLNISAHAAENAAKFAGPISPLFFGGAIVFSAQYEKAVVRAGKRNIDRATNNLKEQYKWFDEERFLLAEKIVKIAFDRCNPDDENDKLIAFYLFRAVFECKLSNQELTEPDSNPPEPRVLAIQSIQETIEGLYDKNNGLTHAKALEQIDDWPQNQDHTKYTKRSKLAILDALPVLKMMAIDGITDKVREDLYSEDIEEMLNLISTGKDWDSSVSMNFSLDIKSTDNKLAFGFYIKQALIEDYDENLIFGRDEAKKTTLKNFQRNIKRYLEYEKPKKIKEGEKPRAIPSKSRLLKHTEQGLHGLSKAEKERAEKLDIYNQHYLSEISEALVMDSKSDVVIALELSAYAVLTNYGSNPADKLKLIEKSDRVKDQGCIRVSDIATTNKRSCVKSVIEMVLDQQATKLIPSAPYKGVGLKVNPIKIVDKFVLQIDQVFSPEIARFKKSDVFVDGQEFQGKSITHIIDIDGVKKDIDSFRQEDGELNLVAIKKLFSGDNDVQFFIGDEKYICEARDKKVFVTKDCQNLKTEIEIGGAIYNPFEYGVEVFIDEDSRGFRDLIKEESNKKSIPPSDFSNVINSNTSYERRQDSQSDNSSDTESDSVSLSPSPSPSPRQSQRLSERSPLLRRGGAE